MRKICFRNQIRRFYLNQIMTHFVLWDMMVRYMQLKHIVDRESKLLQQRSQYMQLLDVYIFCFHSLPLNLFNKNNNEHVYE